MPKILVKRVQEDEYAAEIGQDSREDEYAAEICLLHDGNS